ncbi:MAG: hypothetical protein HY801_16720 [Candidatus Lindowbacteria bacterium]|nr:hypothetical protein [Candidatus Lindowbacteria bacterium]
MPKRRIEGRESIEAYISQSGFICLSQPDPLDNGENIIQMTEFDVPLIVEWLQELLQEHKSFVPEDAGSPK